MLMVVLYMYYKYVNKGGYLMIEKQSVMAHQLFLRVLIHNMSQKQSLGRLRSLEKCKK